MLILVNEIIAEVLVLKDRTDPVLYQKVKDVINYGRKN